MGTPTPGDWSTAFHTNQNTWMITTDNERQHNTPDHPVASISYAWLPNSAVGGRDFSEERANAYLMTQAKNLRDCLEAVVNARGLSTVERNELRRRAIHILALADDRVAPEHVRMWDSSNGLEDMPTPPTCLS